VSPHPRAAPPPHGKVLGYYTATTAPTQKTKTREYRNQTKNETKQIEERERAREREGTHINNNIKREGTHINNNIAKNQNAGIKKN